MYSNRSIKMSSLMSLLTEETSYSFDQKIQSVVVLFHSYHFFDKSLSTVINEGFNNYVTLFKAFLIFHTTFHLDYKLFVILRFFYLMPMSILIIIFF